MSKENNGEYLWLTKTVGIFSPTKQFYSEQF